MTTRDIHERGVDATFGRTTGEEACPECNGSLVTMDGETICAACGLVVAEDRVDRGPEWRAFEADSRNRVGAPLTATRHDRGLSTKIGRGDRSSSHDRRQLARMRQLNERAKFESKADRNLATAFGEIARMVSALELPQPIKERACEIYRQAHNEDMILGRSIESIAAGSLYGACRCGDAPRTLDDIAEVARCERSMVALGYNVLNQELGLAATVTRPLDLVPRILSELNAPERIRIRAHELASQAEAATVDVGCSPSGVAAACVWRAGQENGAIYTQQQVADVAGVTPVTLRDRVKEIRERVI